MITGFSQSGVDESDRRSGVIPEHWPRPVLSHAASAARLAFRERVIIRDFHGIRVLRGDDLGAPVSIMDHPGPDPRARIRSVVGSTELMADHPPPDVGEHDTRADLSR
jgi:hypothetical protein